VVFNSRLPYGQLEKPRSHSLEESSVSSPVFPSEPTKRQVSEESEILQDLELSQLMIDDPESFELKMIDEQIHGRRTPDEAAQDLGSE
jgi:hypothetical protein